MLRDAFVTYVPDRRVRHSMNLPVSTQWVLDAVGTTGRVAVSSVFLVYCQKTGSKGTGWLHKSGKVITNEHVVRGCGAVDILIISSTGHGIAVASVDVDAVLDLALLSPASPQAGGLELDVNPSLNVGMLLHAWGHPLGYNGPPPLLSVGYLAGFSQYGTAPHIRRHLVVNGAYNPGNSGGPVFAGQSDKVLGVIVSKHAPLAQFHEQAINALAKNSSGVVFTWTQGNTSRTFVEGTAGCRHTSSLSQPYAGDDWRGDRGRSCRSLFDRTRRGSIR